MTWLDSLMESTEEFETPRQFWYWSGLSILSAIVKDKVWVERGGLDELRVFPNVYCMLFARSGLRKSTPVAYARRIVKYVNNTRVFSGRASIEAIVQELGKAYTTPEPRRIITDACAFITASEFSSSMINNTQALTILTDLYDRNYNSGEWKNVLKHAGVDILKNPTITLFCATNPPHLKDFVPTKDMYGGFFGRTFIIHADKKHRTASLFGRKLVKIPEIEKLGEYLKEVGKLSGPFTNTEDSANKYEKWYNEVDERMEEVEDKTGTAERIGDAVLKVASLLSLSSSLDMLINSDHIDKAIELCEPLLNTVARATRGKGKSSFGDATAIVLEEIWRGGGNQTRHYLLTKHWSDFDAIDLDRVIITLEDRKAIESERVNGVVTYRMFKKVFEQYDKWMKEKQ
jgi:hypothetical protein